MLNTIFQGVFDSTTTTVITPYNFLLCLGAALLIGLIIAAAGSYKSHYTKSFIITLATLPAIVCVVIMAVNGNIGAGVAVAGAFSLVRFRSIPGTAKEIGAVFLAMGAGLMCGMGYLGYAVLFSCILSLVTALYFKIGSAVGKEKQKLLRITIPEDLDYTGVFDDLFAQYTSAHETVSVKTTNMGSLFKLTYRVTLKDPVKEKEFIDALRCRNGNLEISMMEQEENDHAFL